MVGLVVPELQNPIFPALAEVVGGALAQRASRRCSARRHRRHVRGRVRRHAARAAGVRDDLRRRPVRGGRRAARPLRAAAEAARCRSCSSTPPSSDLDFPRVSTATTRSRWSRRYGHLAYAGPRADRAGPGPARPRAVAAQAGRASSDRSRAAASALAAELVERTRFSLEGGQAAAARLIARGVTGDRLRERPARARRHPRGAARRARGARPTSRSSATTTRRS